MVKNMLSLGGPTLQKKIKKFHQCWWMSIVDVVDPPALLEDSTGPDY
jgi:hypothetical protein